MKAIRPIFVPSSKRGSLFEWVDIDFEWFPGFAAVQKEKSIYSLHLAAKNQGIYPILEVSTKSNEEVGRRLSAFNLKLEVDGEMLSLESVYQGSKVFSESGQHTDLMYKNPYIAKKLVRQLGIGNIVGFRCFDMDFPTEPKNAFYDWLYIRAISPHENWVKKNLTYAGYSDIEFNPKRSINCQGRAVAEFMSLVNLGASEDCFNDFNTFRDLLRLSQRHG